jgi:hypothetical protein
MAGEADGSDLDLDKCWAIIHDIALLLRAAKKITPEKLQTLCATEPAFGLKRWDLDQMKPARAATWRRVIFADNAPAKLKHPDEPGERLHILLQKLRLLDKKDFKTPAPTDHASWRIRLQEVCDLLREKLQRQNLGTPDEDLAFIGGVEEAINKLEIICTGATTIYNTVFTRSDPDAQYAAHVVPQIEQIKNDLLSAGNCTWLDIVLSKELPKFRTLRNAPDNPLRQANLLDRHQYRVLNVELPLFQCLVFRRGEESGAALVGWMFLGSSEARVYFSDEWKTVKFFYDYCHHLYWHVAKDDQPPDN